MTDEMILFLVFAPSVFGLFLSLTALVYKPVAKLLNIEDWEEWAFISIFCIVPLLCHFAFLAMLVSLASEGLHRMSTNGWVPESFKWRK